MSEKAEPLEKVTPVCQWYRLLYRGEDNLFGRGHLPHMFFEGDSPPNFCPDCGKPVEVVEGP